VELNLKALTLKVRINEEIVTFYDASLPATTDIPHSAQLHKLLDNSICGALLLIKPPLSDTEQTIDTIPLPVQAVLEFEDIFSEPTSLPPKRKCDHVISRIPHHQKNIMEKLVTDLLKNKFVRPSNSPYSSPALVVKKKDFDWCLYIDLR
jgi:hypothetical protein